MVNIETAIKYMYDLKAKGIKYSMSGSRTGADGTGDCSGTVYQALRNGGATNAGWVLNTDSMHGWLTKNSFKLIAQNKEWTAKRGDVVIFGKKGQSGGAAGHVVIFISNTQIIHCTWKSASANGIYVDNEATTCPYDMGWYVYRLEGQTSNKTSSTSSPNTPLPVQRKISPYNHYDTNKIKYIVIHDVGNPSTAKNNADYFYGGNRGASAHYFIDDTSIWQVVEDNKGAWHVGDGENADGTYKFDIGNQNSIGIEMCLPSGKVTEKTEGNTVEFTKYLMKKYNVPITRVVRHYDASRKNCPAQFNLDGKWTRWNSFKKKLAVDTTTKTPVTSTKTNFKVGDKVKIKIALYSNAEGAGRSTKSVGKTGTIKRDVKKGKRYLIDNLGWAHENDIELVNSQVTYSEKKVGTTVTVQSFATNYQTGQKITSFVKGNKYKIKQVKTVNQSKSKRAYLLDGINSWMLEQDVK